MTEVKYDIGNGHEISIEYDENNQAKITRECFEELIEKQTPKKPIPIDWEKYKGEIINAEFLKDIYWCPNCRRTIKSGSYCQLCGQSIDWRNEE